MTGHLFDYAVRSVESGIEFRVAVLNFSEHDVTNHDVVRFSALMLFMRHRFLRVGKSVTDGHMNALESLNAILNVIINVIQRTRVRGEKLIWESFVRAV